MAHEKGSKDDSQHPAAKSSDILQNVVAGLAVSFVALILGAAFGVLSGRGAFAGMLSAAIIPIITSALGGTPVQMSGPTAPMSALTAVLVAFAYDDFARLPPEYPTEQFISLAIFATAVILLLAAALRLGRFILLVPNLVVSGFMDGIAILIWWDIIDRLGGFSEKAYGGGPTVNILLGLFTVAIVFATPGLAHRYLPAKWASICSGTLVALLVMSSVAHFVASSAERVVLPSIDQLGHPMEMIAGYVPRLDGLSAGICARALGFGLQLALLAYLDTLLTALVVDQITKKPTEQNRELAAQGLATFAVGVLGGIPGAQATIRCLLILKEGATRRWSGMLAGVFVLSEMLFRDLIALVPLCVLGGILIKVGWDVFDWTPVRLYLLSGARKRLVSHRQMLVIAGTTLVTVAVNLNVAVILFTILFYLLRKLGVVYDLSLAKMEGLEDEP